MILKWLDGGCWYKSLFSLVILFGGIGACLFSYNSYAAGKKVTCFITDDGFAYCKDGDCSNVIALSKNAKTPLKKPIQAMPFSVRYPCVDAASFQSDIDFQLVFVENSAITHIEEFEKINVIKIFLADLGCGYKHYYAFEWRGKCVVLPPKFSEGNQSFLRYDRHNEKGAKAPYHVFGLLFNKSLYGMVMFTDRCIVTGAIDVRKVKKKWGDQKRVDVVHVIPANKERQVDFRQRWNVDGSLAPIPGLDKLVAENSHQLFKPVIDVKPEYSLGSDFKYDWVLPLGDQSPEDSTVFLYDSDKVAVNEGSVFSLFGFGTWNGAGTTGYDPEITTRILTCGKFSGIVKTGESYFLQGSGSADFRSRHFVFKEEGEITQEASVKKNIDINITPEPPAFVEDVKDKEVLKEDPFKGVLTKSLEEKYTLVKEIGKGSEAKIYSARLRGDDSKQFAIRVKTTANPEDVMGKVGDHLTLLRRESLVIEKLIESGGHENVVKFHHVELDTSTLKLCIVMDFYNKGLAEYRKEKGGKFSCEVRKNIIRDVCKGLNFLHERQIIHRDIKEENIMMSNDGQYVITDFGFSHRLSDVYDHKELDGFYRGTPAAFPVEPDIVEECYNKDLMSILEKKIVNGFSYRDDAHALWGLLVKLGTGRYPSEISCKKAREDRFFVNWKMELHPYTKNKNTLLLLKQILLGKWILSNNGVFSLELDGIQNRIENLCSTLDMKVNSKELDFMAQIVSIRESGMDQYLMQKLLSTSFLQD
ncbi:protein kinase family protein [Candidatus Sororendozoicomonas aggregata]|uniref:protein kinase family protein n=1 Tax=Candidatus Sororendozoicomonas aggregata TaxID=3073239 RepID=UPI002ED30857